MHLRRPSPWLRFGVLAVWLMTGTGCSFIFVKGPPDHPEALPPRAPIDCTSSVFAPILDSVVGAYQVVRTGVAVAAPDSVYSGSTLSRPADIAIGAGLTALFVSSAVYGFTTSNRCGEAQRAHVQVVEPSASFLPGPAQPVTRPGGGSPETTSQLGSAAAPSRAEPGVLISDIPRLVPSVTPAGSVQLLPDMRELPSVAQPARP